jgi:hypothetical protein
MNRDFDAAFADGFDELPETVDEAAIERLRAVAYLLDEQVQVPGTGFRVGIDPLVSVIPGVGPIVSGGLSLYIVLEAAYLGVSFSTVVRMLANIAIDTAGSAVPYVGVVFDAVWKTNKMNLELLLEDLLDTPSDPEADPMADDEPVLIEVE